MKYTYLFLLCSILFSCADGGNEDKVANQDKEYSNLEKYYFPLNSDEPIIYKYLVKRTEGNEPPESQFIYTVFQKLKDDHYCLTSYDQLYNLIDSAVLVKKSDGMYLKEQHSLMSSGNNELIPMEMQESKIFNWTSKIDQSLLLIRKSSYNGYPFPTETKINGVTTFKGIKSLKKPFQGKQKYIELQINSVTEVTNKLSGQKKITTETLTLMDLEGHGLYGYSLTDEYGDTETMTLYKQLTSEEWKH